MNEIGKSKQWCGLEGHSAEHGNGKIPCRNKWSCSFGGATRSPSRKEEWNSLNRYSGWMPTLYAALQFTLFWAVELLTLLAPCPLNSKTDLRMLPVLARLLTGDRSVLELVRILRFLKSCALHCTGEVWDWIPDHKLNEFFDGYGASIKI